MSGAVRMSRKPQSEELGSGARVPAREGENAGTVVRLLRLLRCIAGVEGDIGLTELATALSLPPSTVHRLLQLLMDQGLVERTATGHRYRPGMELFRLGSIVVSHTRIADVALPFMQAVVAECNESCMLVLYLPTTRQVMIAKSLNSTHPLRYQIEHFVPLSLCWGATGRSVLAFLPPHEVAAAVSAAEPSPVDGRPLPPAPAFEAELEEIRRTGYAYTQNQKMAGAVGIGAPLFGADGRVLGSLCVTIPQMRFQPQAARQLGALVKAQADLLSRSMGYRGGRPTAA